MFLFLSGRVAVLGCLALLVLPLAAGASRAAGGEPLTAGTRIDGGALADLEDREFHGTRLADLVTDRIAWQMRTFGLTLELADPKPYPDDPRFEEATAKFAKDVRFDPATGRIDGWKAGLPFPEVDAINDPNAAIKIVWNLTHGRNGGDIVHNPGEVILLIDRQAGLERLQHWTFTNFKMKGILRFPETPVLGDGDILAKTLFFAMSPQDIKGVGTFTIKYDTGRLNDSWAYVRDVRRIRRLSGSTWMDRISGTDWLNDDFSGFGAYPTWYEDFEILGRTEVLLVANSRMPTQILDASSENERFPRFDLASAPHWNVIDDWEPRDVYIVKATPPDAHPYGYKILYIGADGFHPFLTEMYDKAGNHMKTQILGQTLRETVDDVTRWAVHEAYDMTADFQSGHATAFASAPEVQINPPMAEEDVSLSVLETMGR